MHPDGQALCSTLQVKRDLVGLSIWLRLILQNNQQIAFNVVPGH